MGWNVILSSLRCSTTGRNAWVRVMQQCIAVNASFFNTHRMVRQYMQHAYALQEER
jgi:starch phosphorylase